jgi:hypothetical protein
MVTSLHHAPPANSPGCFRQMHACPITHLAIHLGISIAATVPGEFIVLLYVRATYYTPFPIMSPLCFPLRSPLCFPHCTVMFTTVVYKGGADPLPANLQLIFLSFLSITSASWLRGLGRGGCNAATPIDDMLLTGPIQYRVAICKRAHRQRH